MDPTVAAAAIGVGGTVIVGVAGFSAGVWNTRKTIAQARENRVWDKRAAAYEMALAELTNRQLRRDRVVTKAAMYGLEHELLDEYLVASDTSPWSAAQSQLLAYSSKDVLAALDTARLADQDIAKCLGWLGSKEAVRNRDAAIQELAEVMSNSGRCDSALIDLIRRELQGARASAPRHPS
jgi:hypothetical protein